MPEIPEVEAFKKIIEDNCLNKEIIDIEAPSKEVIKKISFLSFKKNLISHKFKDIERKGKYLIIDISGSYKKLVMHFGLTGFLVYSKKLKEKVRFSAVNFIFKNSILHWISIRKFEKIWLIDNLKDLNLDKLGPDALKVSKKEFLELSNKNKSKNIKSFLMNQKIISGIGNEYSDEILFQTGVDPHHSIKDLTSQQLIKIYNEMNKVLKYAIKLRIKNFQKDPKELFFSSKDRKTFKSSYLQAHRHTNMICPKNKKHKLVRIKIGGRSAYYCPEDQK